MPSPILTLAGEAYPEAVALRRAIHAHPELSGFETGTARLVYNSLSRLGLKPRYHVHKTGVSAQIVNGKGKTVVLRADMDALPLDEQTSLSYKSCHKGIMHACGHDMHTACLLGAARVLCRMKQAWRGTVVLLFQPSEEVAPGGAVRMIEEGVFPPHADAVFGLHVSTDHPSGSIGIRPGRDYSGVMDFDITITGKGGHGAAPHAASDPIVCACSIVLALQTLISRESPASEPSVLTVGSLHAGTHYNIIPDQATFSGTIRSFSEEHLDFLKRRVGEIAAAMAAGFNARCSCGFIKGYPPGCNDEDLSGRAMRAAEALLGKGRVVLRAHPTMFAEDFA
jgi:amidohydrolase